MQPPKKKQKIDPDFFDPFYGDYLKIDQYNIATANIFPKLSRDLAHVIINSMDFNTLSCCASVNKSFKKIAYHHFAIKRTELYQRIFTPEDWNLRVKSARLLTYEERKKAFRRLPPTINPKEFSIAFAIDGFSIKSFSNILREKFPANQYGYGFLSGIVMEHLGDDTIKSPCWIGVPRLKYNKSLKPFKNNEISKTLQRIICIFTEYVKFELMLFSDLYCVRFEYIVKEKIVITSTVKMGLGGIEVNGESTDAENMFLEDNSCNL
jgi:hypothetical protein